MVRGDLADRAFVAFWLRDGRVTAALNVNVWDHGDALQRIVDGQLAVAEETLRTGDLPAVG
ncbi:NAD/ferredoxin-dependent reductase-like protein [Prauserella shujinwangii]|uniref:NAD/ferredoxin-dependent reductase-like protein n=1 Tax=Prauserella shujinwangii TaxID=1453103 RepID=A0A2T0LTT0_9PSEU|nr:NAD/ferredoxin-dependent reductase-like protein [Prauserella shujinwangii]